MKKALSVVLLLSGLFLYGCGAGGNNAAPSAGGNSTSNPGNPGGGSQPQLGSPQVFTLNLVDADSARVVSRHTTTATAASYPAPSTVRVVMRIFKTVTSHNLVCPEEEPCFYDDVTGISEVYKDIQDLDYDGTGSVIISMPSATYTIDVITSLQSSPTATHKILKHGQRVDVPCNASNRSASITMKDAGTILDMQVTDDVLSSTDTHTVSFNVTVNNASPFAPNYSLFSSYGTYSVNKSFSSSITTISAPKNTSGLIQPITVTGTFNLNDAFRKSVDPAPVWERIFPDPAITGEHVYYNVGTLVDVTVL